MPAERYVFGEWGMAKVHGDHHVEVDRHYYSAPHVLHQEVLDVCLTATTVELLYKGERVALHPRSYGPYGSTTLREHRPPNHRAWADADPTRVIAWAEQVGVQTTAYVRKLVDMRPTGLRSALGLKRVAEPFEPAQIEAACAEALRFDGRSYLPVARILKLGTRTADQRPRLPSVTATCAVQRTSWGWAGSARAPACHVLRPQ